MPAALSPIVKEQAKHMIAAGIDQTAIADNLGISTRSVKRINKADRKDIEKFAIEYINDSIKPIKQAHKNQLELSAKISHLINNPGNSKELNDIKSRIERVGLDTKTLMTLADKKEFRALQIMGVAPSNTASLVVNNIFSQTTNNIIDPSAQKVIDAHCIDLLEDDSIQDAEVLTDDTINNDGNI